MAFKVVLKMLFGLQCLQKVFPIPCKPQSVTDQQRPQNLLFPGSEDRDNTARQELSRCHVREHLTVLPKKC